MSDWKDAIAEQISGVRDRLAGVSGEVAAAHAAAACATQRVAHLTVEGNEAMVAKGAMKHAQQRLQALAQSDEQLRAEVTRLEATHAIPARLEQAQVAMVAAGSVVTERTAVVGEARRTLQTLQARKTATQEALEGARTMAGARMLEAAKSGTASSTDDTAQLISQLDAIELAIATAQAEEQDRQKDLAAALAKSKAASAAVEGIALEASEFALQAFTEQYVKVLASHMHSYWQVHHENYPLPDIRHLAIARVQAMQAG